MDVLKIFLKQKLTLTAYNLLLDYQSDSISESKLLRGESLQCY